ncbi:MAG TPA: tryptophan 7-halogenase [Vicinamibacterales bacterium]|nr:tryptophan 7-halogenase [Vicinamibacterales bacterium]
MREFDAIVLGAGPAGCGAARLLAAWGHKVLLVEKPAAGSRTLALSIPPSARNGLAALGMLNAVEAAAFQAWRGNTVWWGDNEPRIEPFAHGAYGFQVVHGDLLDLLRPLAARAGAELQLARVQDVVLPDPEAPRSAPAAPVVVMQGDAGSRATAPFVLDCTGRAGVIARRRGLREPEASHHTVALGAAWCARSRWPVPDETHTLVASYADGWAWSIPTERAIRHFTVMVDPDRTDLLRGRPAVQVYRAELEKVRPLRAVLEAGEMRHGPWGHDASLYAARQYAGPGFLLVGDAGSFIDPLSSFGVKKALASAWVASVATHTALVSASMRDEALAFYDRRERAVYASCRRQSAAFAADAAAGARHPFWLARALASDDEDETLDSAVLERHPRVLAAFDELRRRATVRLRRAPRVHTTRRPVIRGREIVTEEHLVLPECPEGIRYLRGVDLIGLMEAAPEQADVGALYDAYASRCGPIDLPDYLCALSALIAFGVLEY